MPISHKRFTHTKNIANKLQRLLALMALFVKGTCSLSAMLPENEPPAATQELTPEEKFFGDENSFYSYAQAIAHNPQNLTDQETLKTSVNNILKFSSLAKQYRADLDYLLRGYAGNEHDNASRGIKVMRYVLITIKPEEKNDLLLLRSFQAAQDLITLLNRIDNLTNQQIEQGNLVDNSVLGQLFNDTCNHVTSIPVRALFKKIEAAIVNNPQGLLPVLNHQDDDGYSALISAIELNIHQAVIATLITGLQQAFENNHQGLQQALTQQNNDGYSALISAAELNSDQAVIATLITGLQQAFEDNHQGLQQALTQQNNDGSTALLVAAAFNTNQAVIATLISSLQQAFGNNHQGLQQALTQQNNDGSTALIVAAAFNTNQTVIATLIAGLQQAFGNNYQGLQQALTQQDNFGRRALNRAIQRNNQPAITALENALAQAETAMAQQQET